MSDTRNSKVTEGLSPLAAAFYAIRSTWSPAFHAAADAAYGAGFGAWLQEQVATIPDDYQYDDSYRLAVAGNAADEERFEQEITCCGSARFQWTHPSGVTVWYGFNHGH